MITTKQKARLEKVLEAAEESGTTLSAWEQDFLANLEERLAKYDDRLFVSDKQWDALAKIEEALDVGD